MRTAVITGGSSGIGLEVARRLARRGGWRLLLAARDEERLAAAAAGLPARAVRCDVTDAGDVARLAAAAAEEGGCDLLVNSAGRPGRLGVLEAEPDDYRAVMETNLIGMVRVTQALFPQIEERRGRIANVVSVAGTVALARSGPYCASKHAALAFSRGLMGLAAPRGVTVTTVNPGPVHTPGFSQETLLRGRLTRFAVIDVEDLAERILSAVDRGRPEVFAPRPYKLAAVAQAVAPGTVARISTAFWNARRPSGRGGGAQEPVPER